MIAYHCHTNLIMAVPFKTMKDTQRLIAYNKTMQRLSNHKLNVELQILDNEASTEYKRVLKKKLDPNYQLVPPNTHRRNAAEQSIRTLKAHFIAILAGVAHDFPINLWNLLLPQTGVTLNLLRQANLNSSISAWAYFHTPFNYDATPLGPLGCNIISHKKAGTRNLWGFRGTGSWNVGVSLQHYRCHTILSKATK